MEFDNSFEVPLAPDQAWTVLLDIPRIAPAMPGAELTEIVDPQNYAGKIAVRLGPVALTFAGRITFESIDAANHSARVKAQGSDAKGRGAASATAAFRIEPSGDGSKVLIHTDLMLSGAVAQYGRGVGMIQATAAQIINQFARNLHAQLVREQPAAPAASAPAPASEPATPLEPAPPPPTAGEAKPDRTAAQSAAATPRDERGATQPLPPAPPAMPQAAKPISGLSLMARVLWQQVAAMFTGRRR